MTKLVLSILLLASVLQPLTLEETREAALENHPSISAAQSALDAAEARVRVAKAGRMPLVGFSGLSKAGLSGAMNGLNPVGIANSPFFRNFAAGAQISHPGLDFGRTKSNIAIEQERFNAAQADLASTQADVLLAVESAYFDALRAKAQLAASRQAAESRELTARQARAFYEAELRSKVDFGLAEAQLASAQAELADAAGRSDEATARLAFAVGVAPEALGSLTEPPLAETTAESLDELIARGYEQRPDLDALEAGRDSARAVVDLARAQRRPWLRIFFTGGWARFNPLQLSSLTAIGTGLAMPLLTFGRTAGVIEEAEALLARAERRLEEARQLVALETRIAYYATRSATAKLPLREKQTAFAAEAVRLARARYREQLGTLVELAQAETELTNANAAASTARFDLQAALAELRYAVGEL